MSTAKVENAEHGWRAKADIRRRVLELLTPAKAVVFDAFAGPGLMWKEVWKDAAGYVGCDEKWFADDRCCYVADNRRVLRCMDLAAFTCFDLDAYGSPWEQALIIAARRRVQPRELVGLVVTEGAAKRSQSYAMLQAAGLSSALLQKFGPLHGEVSERALLGIVRRMNGRVVKQWRAITGGQQMRYSGVVIEGVRR